MNQLYRLANELQQLAGPLGPRQMTRYASALVTALPDILRQRSLAPADARMTGAVRFAVNGTELVLPLTRIAALLEGHDATPTFGGLREMCASNVYLRAFKPGMPLRTVVDLGANRGLFSLLAVKGYGARIAVGVEPSTYFVPVATLLREANGVPEEAMPRETKFIAPEPGADAITMETLMSRYALAEVDFLKCDIEGGEFGVLLRNNAFLSTVANLAMELHPDAGPVASIVAALREKGLTVRVTDQFGASNEATPHYLYASRTGHLN